jgi:hypothetical protein
MRKHFSNPALVFFAAVGLQGLWRLVLEPMAQTSLGGNLGNFIYVLLRVGVILGLPLVLAWGCGFSRFGALAATALATLIESVGFQALTLSDPGEGSVVLGLLTAFMFNLPIVLLFGLAGYEMGRRLGPGRSRPEPPGQVGG